jgi:chemotaxis protein methyltransferase CheR
MAVSQTIENGREFHFTEKDFKFIVNYAFEKTGISISDNKKDMIYSRIAKRIRALKLDTFAQYCNYLSGNNGGDEIADFVNAVTTNLTKFFREMHHFEHLQKISLPNSIGVNQNTKKLRIWSAGCSSGMEPYSIAMTLRKMLPNINSWDAKILATDIDTNMLATGTSGIYNADAEKDIPKEFAEYLSKAAQPKKIEMSSKIKNLISFKHLNLIEPWPMSGPFDIIFCRNVVIYFNKDTQKGIFDKYADLLRPDGYLYIGHSESLYNVSDRFELVGKTTYRKIK